jgi:hypothetical protein
MARKVTPTDELLDKWEVLFDRLLLRSRSRAETIESAWDRAFKSGDVERMQGVIDAGLAVLNK